MAKKKAPTIIRPDDVDPHYNWTRPIGAPGHTQVDFEERINFRRPPFISCLVKGRSPEKCEGKLFTIGGQSHHRPAPELSEPNLEHENILGNRL